MKQVYPIPRGLPRANEAWASDPLTVWALHVFACSHTFVYFSWKRASQIYTLQAQENLDCVQTASEHVLCALHQFLLTLQMTKDLTFLGTIFPVSPCGHFPTSYIFGAPCVPLICDTEVTVLTLTCAIVGLESISSTTLPAPYRQGPHLPSHSIPSAYQGAWNMVRAQ